MSQSYRSVASVVCLSAITSFALIGVGAAALLRPRRRTTFAV